jgi:hypothetical protein
VLCSSESTSGRDREWSDQIPEDEDDDLESMFMSVLRRMNEEADENEAPPR